MAVALVVAVVVAVAAVTGLLVVRQRDAARADRAEERADQLTTRLAEAVELLEQLESQKRAAEVRATAADGRTKAAEQKATDAERRVGDAEKRVADALRRADEATRAKADPGPLAQVLELERLRVLREWTDVVGPGVDLPVAWDGGIAAVVATELAVIRETMGTPSELALAGGTARWEPALAAVGARVGVELLRRLARSGEEMTVELDRAALAVTQPLSPDEQPPDLADLMDVSKRAGLALDVEPASGRWRVVLSSGSRP